MSSSRPRLARLAAVAPVLLAGVSLPAAASASPTTANQWSGGALSPDRQSGASRYPTRGTLVSMTTSSSAARLSVSFQTPRCGTAETLRGRVVQQAGGTAEHLAISVEASRRVRNRRERLDYLVALRPASPGVLVGTAAVRGTFRNGRRTIRCNASSAVTVRSRSTLVAPPQPFSTDAALPRLGVFRSTISPRVLAAIAITKRVDGFHHAMWTERIRCVSGGRRSSFETVDVVPRFRIRADGSFRGRHVVTDRGRDENGRYVLRFVGTVRGRIGADGIARGVATSSSRFRQRGFYDKVCSIGTVRFEAAP